MERYWKIGKLEIGRNIQIANLYLQVDTESVGTSFRAMLANLHVSRLLRSQTDTILDLWTSLSAGRFAANQSRERYVSEVLSSIIGM
jgi:hypothetical protein